MSTIIYQRSGTTIHLKDSKIYKVIEGKDGFCVSGVRELAFFKSGIEHPNILKLVNYSLNPEIVIMELPRANGTLCTTNIPDIYKTILSMQLLSAVRYLHLHKIMHRDIKPTNVLIFKTTDGYTAQLADFGSSRCMPAPWTREFTMEIYTRWYRAPEIIMGKTYDFTADMWSLGCTILELHDGLPLFNGDNNEQVLERIKAFRSVTGRYRKVFDSLNKTSPQLTNLMDTMLQMNPEMRVKFCEDAICRIQTIKLSTRVDVEKLMNECKALDLTLETFWKALTFISYTNNKYWDIAIYLASKITEIFPMDSKYLPINYRDQEKTLLEKVIHIAYIPGPLELASQVKELEYDEISQEFKKLVSTDMIYSCTNLELANILVKSFQNNKITTS